MIWAFLGGLFVGAFFGLMIAALMVASSKDRRDDE